MKERVGENSIKRISLKINDNSGYNQSVFKDDKRNIQNKTYERSVERVMNSIREIGWCNFAIRMKSED